MDNPEEAIGPGRPASTNQRKSSVPKKVEKQSKKRKAIEELKHSNLKNRKKKSLSG